MDCKYILICAVCADDHGTHKGFGIAAIDNGSMTISAALDLSCNESEVAELVKRCNELKLSPVHFQDVIEDFLS